MKRTVNVTITKELEIDIPDELLTPEKLKEFSSGMWEVSEPHELLEYAAQQIAQYGEIYVEGLGQSGEEWMRNRPEYFATVIYRENYSDFDTEIVE